MRTLIFVSLALGALSVTAAAAADAPNVGSHADIAAVRAAEHRANPSETLGGIHIAGSYALVQWYGNPEGSGPVVFKRSGGARWTQIYHDGGATTIDVLVQHGIPSPTAHQLCSGWPKGTSPCAGFN